MINNLRWIGALGAACVAFAAVGTAQAAPDDRAEARGPGAIEAEAPVPVDTAPWLAALSARSAELNREYGLGDYRRPFAADDRSGLRGSDRLALTAVSLPSQTAGQGSARAAPSAPARVTPRNDAFAWDAAALSVAAPLGIAALLGAGAVSIRYRRGLTP